MIVSSNAFVFSTSLLVVVFRYGFYNIFSWYSLSFSDIYPLSVYSFFPVHFTQLFMCFTYNLIILSFRFNLETDYFINTISLRREWPLGLLFFVTRVSILPWDIFGNFFFRSTIFNGYENHDSSIYISCKVEFSILLYKGTRILPYVPNVPLPHKQYLLSFVSI